MVNIALNFVILGFFSAGYSIIQYARYAGTIKFSTKTTIFSILLGFVALMSLQNILIGFDDIIVLMTLVIYAATLSILAPQAIMYLIEFLKD